MRLLASASFEAADSVAIGFVTDAPSTGWVVLFLGVSTAELIGKRFSTVGLPFNAFDGVAFDVDLQKELKKDKVGSGSWVYLKFFRTLFEANPNLEPEHFNKCPLLFLQPEKDHIIPWSMSKRFYEKLDCQKNVIILENCGHIPMEKPGLDQMKIGALNFLEKLENK